MIKFFRNVHKTPLNKCKAYKCFNPKIVVLSIALLVGINGFGQKKEKFRSGVKLVENTIISEVDSITSILFIFKGDTHKINFYLDLTEKLEKQFKKSGENVDFNYDLSSLEPYQSDLESIPTKIYDFNDYKFVCFVWQSDFTGWDNESIESRKQNYNLNIEIIKVNTNELIRIAKINVNSFRMTTTQNKNSSKMIYSLIIE